MSMRGVRKRAGSRDWGVEVALAALALTAGAGALSTTAVADELSDRHGTRSSTAPSVEDGLCVVEEGAEPGTDDGGGTGGASARAGANDASDPADGARGAE